MTGDLTIDPGTSVAGAVLHLHGDLDLTTIAVLRTAVREAPLCAGQWLIVDLVALEFCDSVGMSALIAARNHATAALAGFALAGVPRHLLTALRVVGLDQVFPMYSTVDMAVRAHGAAAAPQ